MALTGGGRQSRSVNLAGLLDDAVWNGQPGRARRALIELHVEHFRLD